MARHWFRTKQRVAQFSESGIAARLQAVVSCYGYHQFNVVELGRDLIRLVRRRGGSCSPILEPGAATPR
jgi:hypothetical protein